MVCSYIMILFASFVVRGYLVIRLTRLRVCEGGGLDDDDNMYDDEANKCDEDEVSRQSSSFLSWSALSYSLPAILASGPLGRLANRKGRRAPAVCVITGELILSLNTWAVASYECRPEWMLIGFVVEGMMGSYSNLLMVTSAYVADLNYRDKELVSDTFKAERFAFVEASLAIGIILGPFLGGHSLAFMSYDTFYMYVSVGCATLIAYVLMIVPESLNKSECEDSASQSYGFGDTVAALRLVFATRPHNKLKLLKPLVESRRESDLSAASSSGDIRCPLVPEVALVPALKLHKVSLAFMVLFGTYNAVNQLFFLYSNRVWGWDSATYGTFSAISGSVGALNLILFRRLVAYGFGRALEDVPFICFGAAGKVIHVFICYDLTTEYTFFFFFLFSAQLLYSSTARLPYLILRLQCTVYYQLHPSSLA